MKFYLITGQNGACRWERTQRDAEKGAAIRGGECAVVDVPTTRDELFAFLNEQELRRVTIVQSPAAQPEHEALPLDIDAIEGAATLSDQILEMRGDEFAAVLEAAIERLGELRDAGWAAFRSLHPRRGQSPSAERGLRYLALAQLADLEEAR